MCRHTKCVEFLLHSKRQSSTRLLSFTYKTGVLKASVLILAPSLMWWKKCAKCNAKLATNPLLSTAGQSSLHVCVVSTNVIFHSFFFPDFTISDTVSRSGMFCAIATTIDRCKTESVVDVFQVVKAQRIQKPGLVHRVVI